MATRTNTRKSATSVGVDNLVDNTFVPDQRTENQQKWEITPIISFVKHTEKSNSLFSSIDALVEEQDKHMANGENVVYLEGCTLYHNNEDGKEFLKLVLKNASTGVVEENVALFPGNPYTDKYGVTHEAGHNWMAFAEEVKRQYNKQGLRYSSKGGFTALLKSMQTYQFTTWLLFDGKYLNMYVTEDKYLYALKRLAAARQQGNPFQKMLDDIKKKQEAKDDLSKNDNPPFDVK